MDTRVKQILSAAAGITVALGLVWGFHTYLQSRNAPTPAAPTEPVAAQPATLTPVARPPATPGAPAPKEPTADELVARAEAIRANNPAAAEALYIRALVTKPKHPFARSGLIHVLTARQDFEGLVTIYTAFLEKEPTNKKYLYNLAVTQTRLREFLDAEATYRKLLAIEPANRIARENFANILGVQGKYSGAIVAWTALAKLQAGDEKPPIHPWMQIGRLNLLLKQTDNAKAAFLQVLELTSKHNLAEDQIRTAIASELSQAGHHGLALAHCSLAIRANDYCAPAWREQGNIYLRIFGNDLEINGKRAEKDNLTEAIRCWKTSLQCNPKQPKLKARITAAEKQLADLIVSNATR